MYVCSQKTCTRMFLAVLSQTENNPNVLQCCQRSVTAPNCRKVNLLVASISQWEIANREIFQPLVLSSFRQFWETLSNLSNKPLYWLFLLNCLTLPTFSLLSPGIILPYPSVSLRGSPNFNNAILFHLHRAQKQAKPIYGDRSQSTGYLVG